LLRAIDEHQPSKIPRTFIKRPTTPRTRLRPARIINAIAGPLTLSAASEVDTVGAANGGGAESLMPAGRSSGYSGKWFPVSRSPP
jgi:hypothetical protein